MHCAFEKRDKIDRGSFSRCHRATVALFCVPWLPSLMILAHHQVRTQLQAPIKKKKRKNRWEVAQNRNTKRRAQTAPWARSIRRDASSSFPCSLSLSITPFSIILCLVRSSTRTCTVSLFFSPFTPSGTFTNNQMRWTYITNKGNLKR